MSHIAELIAELCPSGVQFKKLGELGVIFGGLTGKSKADFSDGNARFVSYVNVHRNPAVDLQADDYVRVSLGEHQRALQRGDILFTGSSETANDVAISSVVTADVHEPLYLNSFTIGYRLNDPAVFDPDFTKHLFRSGEMRKQLVRTASGVTRFNVSKARLAKVKVPLPPVDVQREIVRVLDLFGGLAADLVVQLDAELDARQRQYAYYRDDLFTFRDIEDVKRVPMGEVGEFIRGRRFTKNDVVEEGIPSIHYGEIYTTYGIAESEAASHIREDMMSQLRYAKPGDVVIAAVGETVEDVGKAVAWLGTTDVAIHDDCFLFRSTELNPKFVSYYLRTAVLNRQKAKYVARAKVKRLSGENLAKLVIPVPPPDEQKRIVNILDKFEALITDISAALPAETNARRKQYEYYRDRLLTFKELAA